MTQVFRSGAFLQQCWSVHPLCLAVKRLVDERTLILTCTSCRSVHHLGLASVVVRAGVVLEESEQPGGSFGDPGLDRAKLAGCLDTHAAALSLREMDVFEDQAVIRCGDCRRHYALQVAAFETHQK